MKHEWTDLEFADWTLLPSEAALLANKTGPTRLGFAVLLKFFQYAARFPLSMQEVPTTAVAYIARQVGVPAGCVNRSSVMLPSSPRSAAEAFGWRNCKALLNLFLSYETQILERS